MKICYFFEFYPWKCGRLQRSNLRKTQEEVLLIGFDICWAGLRRESGTGRWNLWFLIWVTRWMKSGFYMIFWRNNFDPCRICRSLGFYTVGLGRSEFLPVGIFNDLSYFQSLPWFILSCRIFPNLSLDF